MEHKLFKTTLFASFIWILGIILTQGIVHAADTIVYAIRIGDQTLGTLDLNTGAYTQISTTAISEYQLGVFAGVLAYGLLYYFLLRLDLKDTSVCVLVTWILITAINYAAYRVQGAKTGSAI